MEFRDYYKTLGVEKTADAATIKKAFRKLARTHHPDVSKAADATERMAALNEANDVLSDPEKRLAYDTLGSSAQASGAGDFRPPPDWDAGYTFSDSGTSSSAHSDFFEQLFGRAARAWRADARNGAAGQREARSTGLRDDDFDAAPALRGSDHHATIELHLLDAYEGAQRTIVLRSPALDAAGRMVDEERRLEVRIPKGVHEGQHIRLAGKGSAGMGGAPAGDLLLEVQFVPDARWRVDGRDVLQRLPLAPWEAALGTTATVLTPGGAAEVRVPAGWAPGRKLRLKGRGIPGTGSQPAGNLYLELELALPAADNDAGRAAYNAFAAAFPTFEPRPNSVSEHG